MNRKLVVYIQQNRCKHHIHPAACILNTRTFVTGLLPNHLCKSRGHNRYFSSQSWNQTKCFIKPLQFERTQLKQISELKIYSVIKPSCPFCGTTSYQQRRTVTSSSPTTMSVRQENQDWNRVVTIQQCSKNNKSKMLTFSISVLDTHPDDVDQQRSTVVALHGFPGTGNDFESLARKLHERGIRLVAPTSLGMTGSPITMGQLSDIDFSTEGRTKTLKLILEAMNIHRIDMLIGHSAGAWTMYNAGASWENVRCLFGINPGGHIPNRTIRPFLLIKIFAAALHWSVGRLIIKPFLAYVYRILGFKGITMNGDGINLIASQQYVTQQQFENVPLNAGLVRSRRLPVLFTYALNDKIVEPVICSNMAYNVLGIPLENTVMYTDDKTPSRHPFFVPEGWLTRCLVFARGGHVVHLAHEKEIVEQIEDILKHINKT